MRHPVPDQQPTLFHIYVYAPYLEKKPTSHVHYFRTRMILKSLMTYDLYTSAFEVKLRAHLSEAIEAKFNVLSLHIQIKENKNNHRV